MEISNSPLINLAASVIKPDETQQQQTLTNRRQTLDAPRFPSESINNRETENKPEERTRPIELLERDDSSEGDGAFIDYRDMLREARMRSSSDESSGELAIPFTQDQQTQRAISAYGSNSADASVELIPEIDELI